MFLTLQPRVLCAEFAAFLSVQWTEGFPLRFPFEFLFVFSPLPQVSQKLLKFCPKDRLRSPSRSFPATIQTRLLLLFWEGTWELVNFVRVHALLYSPL